MDATKTIDTQVTMPVELYQAIVQQAQVHGQSVSGEIVALLTPLLIQVPTELAQEFADWEAASDEDWLNLETDIATSPIKLMTFRNRIHAGNYPILRNYH